MSAQQQMGDDEMKIGTTHSAPTGEDKELLDLAVKAADLQLKWNAREGYARYDAFKPWNPLVSTEDAIELALKLPLKVSFGDGTLLVSVGEYSIVDNLGEDGATLRRAIVRAAAHVGSLPR
jgi:hypothetical protein